MNICFYHTWIGSYQNIWGGLMATFYLDKSIVFEPTDKNQETNDQKVRLKLMLLKLTILYLVLKNFLGRATGSLLDCRGVGYGKRPGEQLCVAVVFRS